jgi:hypothetical protein
MIESTTGSFTVVDANLPTRKFYWKGFQIIYVTSVMIHYKDNGISHIALSIIDPEYIIPTLDTEQKIKLNSVYSDMSSSGINIIKKRS